MKKLHVYLVYKRDDIVMWLNIIQYCCRQHCYKSNWSLMLFFKNYQQNYTQNLRVGTRLNCRKQGSKKKKKKVTAILNMHEM